MEALPTMQASELRDRAASFANDLAKQLENFNSEYPQPKMDDVARHGLINLPSNEVISPTLPMPARSRENFEAVFCRYIASRCVIIPE